MTDTIKQALDKVNPTLQIGDTIEHFFYILIDGKTLTLTRSGKITELYNVDNRPYCIYEDSITLKPCGFYLDSPNNAVTIISQH